MTDYEFESILKNEVEKMPTPHSDIDFLSAAEKYPDTRKKRRRKWISTAAAIAVILLISGSVAVAYSYTKNDCGIYPLYSSRNWESVEKKSEKYQIYLSEQYGDYCFEELSECAVVPHGESFLKAWIQPEYKALNIEYQSKSTDAESKKQSELQINIGTTDKSYWKEYFGYEGEIFLSYSVEFGTAVETSSREIGDIKLFYRLWKKGDDRYAVVTWIDGKQGICIAISCYDCNVAEEELYEIAEQIIDENKD